MAMFDERVTLTDRFWKVAFLVLLTTILLYAAWSTYWTVRWYRAEIYRQNQVQQEVVGWINNVIRQQQQQHPQTPAVPGR